MCAEAPARERSPEREPDPAQQPETDETPRALPEVEVRALRPRTLARRVPPRPRPRREVIPPPPPVAGAVWVPGYWELEQARWVWARGRWQVARRRGIRFRPPSIAVRGGLRVYLPGAWVRGQRR